MNVSTEAFQVTPNTTGGVSGVLNSTLLPHLPDAPYPALPLEVVVGNKLRDVYLWVLVAVGFPANMACVVTVLSMPMPAYYVALLAVADTVALVIKLLYHQIVTHGAFTGASCYFMAFPAFVSCYANWVLALICLERFIAVCFPFKKQAMFSKRRIVISIVGLAAVLFLIFIPTLLFFESALESGKRCVVRESMQTYRDVWESGLLSTLYFFLPFLLISVFTTIIIRRLQVLRNRRHSSQSSGRSGSRGSEHAVSVMLVSASLIFLVLVLPACVFHLFLGDHFEAGDRQVLAQGYLFYQVVTFLSDTTHAVNFFVYFLSAAKFRTAFIDRLYRCCPGNVRCGRKTSTSYSASRTIPLTATMDKNHLKDSEYCDTAM